MEISQVPNEEINEESECHRHKKRQKTQEDFVPVDAKPVFTDRSPALCFHIHAIQGRARACTIHLPHGPLATPVYMPVGTKGTVKGITSRQLKNLGAQIILGNTYHLALQPGTPLLAEFGGLHQFMGYNGNILTDSGGFQMVSLLELAEITEEGVRFKSPYSGEMMLLRPEDSMEHQEYNACPSINIDAGDEQQNNIGSDIAMQLDDVVSSVEPSRERFEEACHRSVRWLDRCLAAHTKSSVQNLFAIIQGGLDISPGGLRDQCLAEMIKRDLPGYAIGGLAGGESKDSFWRVVARCTEQLPRNKPRYVMGVGYPIDLLVCVALGADMFDCVYPTRTGRFGVALVPSGIVKLKRKDCSTDGRPIQEGCTCIACTSYTRSHLNAMLKGGASLGGQLVTYHNLHFLLRFMRDMRKSILDGRFDHFVKCTLEEMYETKESIPSWVQDALEYALVKI